MRRKVALFAFSGWLLALPMSYAQSFTCEDQPLVPEYTLEAYQRDAVAVRVLPFRDRLVKYTQLAVKHRLSGLASYYSGFFHGRKTANGETFRNDEFSAAHLTLPLGCWVEVSSRATGRKLRMRVNDRGPYAKKFALDLSQAAAKFLGVDTARDRYVDVRIIALPGEDPIPEDIPLEPIHKQPVEIVATTAVQK
jgi:rare lipoprotein A